MPTVRVLFESAGLQVGTFRCLPGDPAWRAENTVGPGYHVAFPGPPVFIAQAGATPVVANPNHAIFYDSEQVYRRGMLSDRGDAATYIAAAGDALRDVLAEIDPARAASARLTFGFVEGPVAARSHVAQRLLVEHLLRSDTPDALYIQESAVRILSDVVAAAIDARAARSSAAVAATDARHRSLVEATKEVLSRRYADSLDLPALASLVGASPFHLARVFRGWTGSTIHAYRTQLRLRLSFDRVADPREELTGVALDMGFASHSHFTDTFRRAFAMSPSEFRRAVGGRHPGSGSDLTLGGASP